MKAKVDQIEGAHRLAFIQCVGPATFASIKYCSRLLLHARRQGGHHWPGTRQGRRSHIFGMDIRAVGKNFEEYRNRGAGSGIKFIRSRVAEIYEDKDHTPISSMRTPRNVRCASCRGLVIWPPPANPARDYQMAATVGIETNDFGSFKTASYPRSAPRGRESSSAAVR